MRYVADEAAFFDGRANWIWSAEGLCRESPDPRPVQCRYFAREIDFPSGGSAVLAVSADTRYMLHVGGRVIARGPQKGDVAHQFFDVLDLSDELAPGRNVLLFRVDSNWKSFPYYGCTGPAASEMSAAGVFVADGYVRDSAGCVTDELRTDGRWRVMIDPAMAYLPDEEQPSYVGYKERVDFSTLPAGFLDAPDPSGPGFEPATVIHAAFRPSNARDPFLPHRLVPRSIAPLSTEAAGFASLREVREGRGAAEVGPDGAFTAAVPAGGRLVCILDAGATRTAYPKLVFSGAAGSRIRLKYAECLVDGDGRKGDRDAVEGLRVVGYIDTILPASGHSAWTPLHWRAFRFVEVLAEAGGEELRIESLTLEDCHYPIDPPRRFESSDDELEKFWEIGVRTQRACAHETFDDCPYYEQLQYTGDAQMQIVFTYAASGVTDLPRQTIRFYHWSRSSDGITQSRYPARPTQHIPYFALHYIFMLHDWYAYTGDAKDIRKEALGAREIVRWFMDLRDASGLVGALPYWRIADWSPEWCRDHKGEVPGSGMGPTALTNFMLIAAMEDLAEILGALGEDEDVADGLRRDSARLREIVGPAFWDARRGVYLDSPHLAVASRLTNAWALLIELPDASTRAALAQRIFDRADLCRTGYFGDFFLFEAWARAGRPDLVTKSFETYRGLARLNVTTWPECPVDPRSDCHAWSNAATYHLLRTVLGISIAEPGCGRMKVEPHPDGMTRASGSFVTPKGPLAVSYDEGRAAPFRLEVPEGVTVDFRWKDRESALGPGLHEI